VAGLALVAVGAACGGVASGGTLAGSAGAVAQPPAVSVALPAVATSAPAVAQVGAGATSFAIVAQATQARYRVQEQLVGANLPNDAVGATGAVSGAVVIDADGDLVADASKITVDLTGLTSDQTRRDDFVKQNTLQTAQFPTAVFAPTGVEGLTQPLPTSGQVHFTLSGNLTVHGVTRPVTWDVTAQAGPQEVTGTATTTVTFEQFGMTPPKVGPVLGVQDALTLEMDFSVARSAA
jgi:polyisoprenoid-binding protein YceI